MPDLLLLFLSQAPLSFAAKKNVVAVYQAFAHPDDRDIRDAAAQARKMMHIYICKWPEGRGVVIIIIIASLRQLVRCGARPSQERDWTFHRLLAKVTSLVDSAPN